MRIRRAFVCLAATATAVLVNPTPSVALDFDNMYQTQNTNWDCYDGERMAGDYCRTDNKAVYIVREPGMTTKGDQDIVDALHREYSPTDLAIHVESKGDYEGSTETDIVYDYHAIAESGVLGWTWCNDATSDYECDQEYVEFDDTDPWWATIVHETGHAVGLTHGAQAYPAVSQQDSRLACMKAYIDSGDDNLGSHNSATINALY